MAQSCTVMAFRKRMKSYGYTEIEIRKEPHTGYYIIKAREPLGKVLIGVKYKEIQMYHSFR